ncbi:MAG: hypothetical protein U9R02_05775 [Thermodesulfobacteriota bacterium]|nr:hypothetical protein [Thermodesulfobacteriota bacterium]
MQIGDNWIRSIVKNKIQAIDASFEFVSSIHPSATIARGVTIGSGTVIMAGAVVNSNSSVGDFCIINTNASMGAIQKSDTMKIIQFSH